MSTKNITPRKIKIIEDYLDSVILPLYPKISRIEPHLNNSIPMIRLYLNKLSDKMSEDDWIDVVDDIWVRLHNMFDISVAIHKVKPHQSKL